MINYIIGICYEYNILVFCKCSYTLLSSDCIRETTKRIKILQDTAHSTYDVYEPRVLLLVILFVQHKCLSQRIETTACPRGDGDLEAMYHKPYGTQYNMVCLIIGMFFDSNT